MSTEYFSLQLDLYLINTLRSFKMLNGEHKFEVGFIESIYTSLYYYQGYMTAEVFDEFAKQNGNLSLKQIVLYLHFVFGSIANLKAFLAKLDPQAPEVSDISKSNANKTNILNVHAIDDLKNCLNHNEMNKIKDQVKSKLIETFTIKIVNEDKDYDKETNTIYIPYNYLKFGIQSKGKLDIYLGSHLAHKINKALSLDLFHAHFAFAAKQGKAQTYSENYSKMLKKIIQGVENLKFDKQLYHQYRTKLVGFGKNYANQTNQEQTQKEIIQLLSNLERTLSDLIISRDPQINLYFEKLLIGMLGHPIPQIRDHAVIFLNVLYDGVDWSKRSPFSTKIRKVNQKFVIDYLIESDQNDQNIVFFVKSNIFLPETRQNITYVFKPRIREVKTVGHRKFISVSLDLGRFTRCGFFDWKLVKLMETGEIKSIYKLIDLNTKNQQDAFNKQLTTRPVQGRFIVHPADTRDLQMHEVFVDFQDGVPDEKGKMIKRGNFKKVKDKLQHYKNVGINTLYLMGVFERDNGIVFDEYSKQFTVRRPEVSALSVTCRQTPNTMLGGKTSFKDLTSKANQLGLRILVDCLTRVSSSRAHKKYKDLVIYQLDSQGKKTTVFGSDGRAIFYEDTCLLNYRKKKVWDLLLQELINFTEEYGIQGIHLDNGQAWPQILSLDTEEMFRKETDGVQAYSDKEIFEGTIVEQNDESGFWGSNCKDQLPNPFIMKLCRNLWSRYPNFLILSEVWGSIGEEDQREISMIVSGPIPRQFKLPIALSQIFGENLRKDGTISQMERKSVDSFKKWYQTQKSILPDGSFIVQSTTYHTWPYPALLYKKATWAVVDLFFTLGDIPMTFIGELDGQAFKVKTANIFTLVKEQDVPKNQLHQIIEQDEDAIVQKPIEVKKKKLVKIESQLFHTDDKQGFGWSVYERRGDAKKKSMVRISSGQSVDDMTTLVQQTQSFVQSQGDWFGNELKNIGKHYENRRNLRQQQKAFKKGIFIPLLAEHKFGWHTHVLAFCRYTKKQFCVVAINFNDGPVDAFINLKPLAKYFPNYENSDLVVKMEFWSKPDDVEDIQFDHFFINEIIDDRLFVHLHNFQSMIWGFNVVNNQPSEVELASQHSLQRLQYQLSLSDQMTIYTNDTASQLIKLITQSSSLQQFLNGFAFLYQKISQINLNIAISNLRDFQKDKVLKCRLFAFFESLLKKRHTIPQIEEKLPFFKTIQLIVESNKLGPICFATPEYAKWTKTGGLGVMTDELTRGLVQLGEDVIVITPIYDNKLKEKPDILSKDGFKYQETMKYFIGNEEYEVGIHYGVYAGVKIYFLHNPTLFPSAFAGDDAEYTVKSMALYAKITLELLCKIKVIPALIVTNDWYTGLLGGYLKNKSFGESFVGTKIFHIAHNLDTNYEGRQYPKHGQGDLHWIHQLPTQWLVDPFWKNLVINPSRCAFMTCDNWGTVSHSYKFQLLRESSLTSILSRFQFAFSYPNGLNIKERQKMIEDLPTGFDHMKAKEKIQQKYFGFGTLDNSFCLFGFVGRITEQKGIHLIVESAENLIRQSHGKIQIILGGNCNYKEEYAQRCAEKIQYLKNAYPYNFWGDPDLFFKDGPLINVGCDFGLMPSKFEPGGIVQHEFFVAGTPVVAMKTGGLQDTVINFDEQTKKGSGFTFEHHNMEGFMYVVTKALRLYQNLDLYQALRKSTFSACIDVNEVSKAYEGEFYRMFNKNFIDKDVLQIEMQKINQDFNIEQFKPQQIVQKTNTQILGREQKIAALYEKAIQQVAEKNQKSIQFKLALDPQKLPKQVEIIGSFDNWKTRRNLKYDQFSQEWKITLNLPNGDYFYKYIVDDEWICNDDEQKDTDIYGRLNNFISVE